MIQHFQNHITVVLVVFSSCCCQFTFKSFQIVSFQFFVGHNRIQTGTRITGIPQIIGTFFYKGRTLGQNDGTSIPDHPGLFHIRHFDIDFIFTYRYVQSTLGKFQPSSHRIDLKGRIRLHRIFSGYLFPGCIRFRINLFFPESNLTFGIPGLFGFSGFYITNIQ